MIDTEIDFDAIGIEFKTIVLLNLVLVSADCNTQRFWAQIKCSVLITSMTYLVAYFPSKRIHMPNYQAYWLEKQKLRNVHLNPIKDSKVIARVGCQNPKIGLPNNTYVLVT